MTWQNFTVRLIVKGQGAHAQSMDDLKNSFFSIAKLCFSLQTLQKLNYASHPLFMVLEDKINRKTGFDNILKIKNAKLQM